MNLNPQEEPVVIESQVEAQELKQLRFLGTVRPHRGHSIFKRLPNGVVQECTEEDFISDQVAVLTPAGTQAVNKRKIKVEEGVNYVSSLNLRNAIRKFNKAGLFSI